MRESRPCTFDKVCRSLYFIKSRLSHPINQHHKQHGPRLSFHKHMRNIVSREKCDKMPKPKPKKCSSLPQNKILHLQFFFRHSSSFHNKCQAKNVFFTSTLFQALHLLFHKVYQALFIFTQKVPGKKKVPGNQVPQFPHIPHPCRL